MNKWPILMLLLLFGCKPHRGIIYTSENINYIGGTWYQTNAILFNNPIHMVGPNEWNFGIERCQVLIREPREYSYQLSGNLLELYPIKGLDYQEWEGELFFNGKIMITKNDSTMLWSIPDTLQILFQRKL